MIGEELFRRLDIPTEFIDDTIPFFALKNLAYRPVELYQAFIVVEVIISALSHGPLFLLHPALG